MNGQLHHIEIWVSNLKNISEFWDWILQYLGYEKHQEWKNGVSFKLGKTYIAFEQAKENLDLSYNRKGVGMNHIAFHMSSQKELIDLVKNLKKKNIPLLYQDQENYLYNGKNKVIHIEDPDGIELEFVVTLKNV